MNENKNKCTILGFKTYYEKDKQTGRETDKEMLRIIICVDGKDDYTGKVPVPVYLESNPMLINDLKMAID